MTDREKLEKLKKLADAMYYAAQQLTTDASRLHKARDEYHKFIINEYHKEESKFKVGDLIMHKTLKTEGHIINISEDGAIDVDCGVYKEYSIEVEEWELVEEPVSRNFETALAEEWQGYVDRGAATVDALEDNTQELAFAKGFYRGANWQKEQLMAKAVDGEVTYGKSLAIPSLGYRLDKERLDFGDKVKVLIIKED